MPSCCRGITCDCRIDSGSNITVTGSGQASDPFIINCIIDLSGYDTIAARTAAINNALLSLHKNVVLRSADYTALPDDFVVVDATAGPVTITLPTAPPTGVEVAVKKVDASANIVTIDPPGALTIDGDPNATIPGQWVGGTFIFDGTNWLLSGGM